jgi:hypothetical protein
LSSKRNLILLGLVTLLVFPIPAFLFRFWAHDYSIIELLDFNSFTISHLLSGLTFGALYALLISKISDIKSIADHFKDQKELLLSFELKWYHYLLLSFCAGTGEELLFRIGIQPFLGIWPTSFLFVAIHGYFSIKSLENNLPGALLMPFIAAIAIGYVYFGIWWCIATHFAYDLIVFHLVFSRSK